jgi:hypothetical protein
MGLPPIPATLLVANFQPSDHFIVKGPAAEAAAAASQLAAPHSGVANIVLPDGITVSFAAGTAPTHLG